MANRNWWVTHDPYWWRGTGNSGPGAPDEPQQQTFGSPIGGGLWPTFLPTGDLGASQTSWSSVLPSANLSPASEHESPVAQTLRQLSPNWPRGDRGSLGLTTPNEPPLQTLLGAYIGNAFWPTPSSSADIGGGQTPSSPLLPHADQPALSAPARGLPRSASDFMPLRVPMPASASGFPAANWPGASAFDQSMPPAPPMPVGYADRMRPQPWGVFPDVFGPWREHFIKGVEGAIKYFSGSGSRTSGGGNEENECDKRYEDERERCNDRYWQTTAKGQNRACKERATTRWVSCRQNGGKPRPDEPPEWGDKDEEVWRNYNR